MMTISDIIEIIVVCALIFSRWAIWRGTLCDAFATPYVCSLLNLVMLNRPGRYAARKKPGQPKMTQFTQNTAMPSSLWQYWRGLSGWNFYFLVKFGLLWAGYLNFHPLLNLVFAAFLLMPIPRYSLHRLRHWIALPIGFALFWHDTWLPGPESIMSQGSQVAGFSTDYLIDLVTRFINWQMIGAIFVLLVAWLFLSQWIRITVFVVAILLWLNVLTWRDQVSPCGQPDNRRPL